MLEGYSIKLIPNPGKQGSYTIKHYDPKGKEISYKEYLGRQPKKSLKELTDEILGLSPKIL